MCVFCGQFRESAIGAIAMAAALFGSVGLQAADIDVMECRASFVDRVTFSTDRTGVVAQVPEEGTRVNPQEIVVRLRDEVPRAVLDVAEARAESEIEIRVAEKTAQAARVEHDAANEANKFAAASNPAYPKTHMLRLELNAQAAALKIEQARHDKRIAELTRDQAIAELATYWIVSDLGGTVTKVFKHKGEGVQQGESIVQVVNTDRLRVEGYVSDESSFLIEPGMPVKVRFAFPETAGDLRSREYAGKLGFVDVSVQPLTKWVRVWAEIDNSDGLLREGLAASMTIQTAPSTRSRNEPAEFLPRN